MAQPCQNSRPLNSVRNTNSSRPVSRVLSGGEPSATAIPLGRGLLRAWSNQPGRRRGSRWMPELPPTPVPPLFGLAPGGVCRAAPLPAARCALTAPFHPCLCGLPRAGGLFSVALSLGSPPAAVSRHRRSLEPGLSSTALDGRKACSRGSGRPAGWHANKGSLGRQVKGHPALAPRHRVLTTRTSCRRHRGGGNGDGAVAAVAAGVGAAAGLDAALRLAAHQHDEVGALAGLLGARSARPRRSATTRATRPR